jgi:hypothetical protein
MRPLSWLALGALSLGGCAWEPGQGFAVVEPTVRAAYTSRADRDTGDGFQRLSSDFQVRLDAATLNLSGIELFSAGSGGGSFDPAHPPEGYTLCHGGHCHREDGALIPYEQVAAELGGTGASAVVTLRSSAPWNLLAPETRAVDCQPSCALPETQVAQGRWNLQALHLEGTVRDSRASPRFSGERRFTVDLPASATEPVATLAGSVDLASDRQTPPRAELALSLELTAALFDGVDFTPDADGEVRVKAQALVERLTKVSPQAEVVRGAP